MEFRPILKTEDGSDVSFIRYVQSQGYVYALTLTGDIYRIDEIPDNAYGHGQRSIYAQILDGEGDFSDISFSDVFHELNNSIITTEFDDEFIIVADNISLYSATSRDTIRGIFTSDIIKTDEDFGFWKTIQWTQTCGLDNRVIVAVKVADTAEELSQKEWFYIEHENTSYYGQSGTVEVSEDLDRFNVKGKLLRFKIELETVSDNVPSVTDLSITYNGKHSVYFFTTKFRLEKNKGADQILLTASQTLPKLTEARFGMVEDNSVEWEDYTPIRLDQLTTIPSKFGDTLKIGIKMASQNLSAFPTVNEFAFTVQSEADNKLNEDG
jgi:hypothetical protein